LSARAADGSAMGIGGAIGRMPGCTLDGHGACTATSRVHSKMPRCIRCRSVVQLSWSVGRVAAKQAEARRRTSAKTITKTMGPIGKDNSQFDSRVNTTGNGAVWPTHGKMSELTHSAGLVTRRALGFLGDVLALARANSPPELEGSESKTEVCEEAKPKVERGGSPHSALRLYNTVSR